MHVVCIRMLLSASICLSTLQKHEGFCSNFKICMGCFVHVILLGVGCFVSLQKNMWWFSSTYNKMDVGCFVRGVFCPTLSAATATLGEPAISRNTEKEWSLSQGKRTLIDWEKQSQHIKFMINMIRNQTITRQWQILTRCPL